MITDVKDITSFKWATVTGVSPVAIQLDGDSAPLALIPDSLVDPLKLAVGSRVRVELSLRKCVIHGKANGTPEVILRGTTAQRNAMFGTPATDAARVALANKLIVWYNTDLGWSETYYCMTGLSGLTVRGLISGIAAGWLPIAGTLITALRDKNGAFESVGTGGAEPLLQTLVTNIGGFIVDGNSGLRVPYNGFYEMIGHIYFSGASMGIAQISFTRNTGSQVWTVPFGATGGSDLSIGRAMAPVMLYANDRVAMRGIPSVGTNFYGAGFRTTCFSVRYLGPPFADG